MITVTIEWEGKEFVVFPLRVKQKVVVYTPGIGGVMPMEPQTIKTMAVIQLGDGVV